MRPVGTDLTTTSYLRAAWALVMSTYAGSDDVIFGEILSGRDIPLTKIEDLVGPTLTLVPRRIRINRTATVGHALSEIRDAAERGHATPVCRPAANQGTRPRDGCSTPGFRSLLVVDAVEENVAEDSLWRDLVRRRHEAGADFFSYPLNVTGTVGRSKDDKSLAMRLRLECVCIFDDKVVAEWQVQRILGLFQNNSAAALSWRDATSSFKDLDLLSPNDKSIIQSWNTNPGPLVERCIHDMITEQMARPDFSNTTAVVGWDAT